FCVVHVRRVLAGGVLPRAGAALGLLGGLAVGAHGGPARELVGLGGVLDQLGPCRAGAAAEGFGEVAAAGVVHLLLLGVRGGQVLDVGLGLGGALLGVEAVRADRKSTRLNSSHVK